MEEYCVSILICFRHFTTLDSVPSLTFLAVWCRWLSQPIAWRLTKAGRIRIYFCGQESEKFSKLWTPTFNSNWEACLDLQKQQLFWFSTYLTTVRFSTPHHMETIYPNPGNEVSIDQRRETCVSIIGMLQQHADCPDGPFKLVPQVLLSRSIPFTSCWICYTHYDIVKSILWAITSHLKILFP